VTTSAKTPLPVAKPTLTHPVRRSSRRWSFVYRNVFRYEKSKPT